MNTPKISSEQAIQDDEDSLGLEGVETKIFRAKSEFRRFFEVYPFGPLAFQILEASAFLYGTSLDRYYEVQLALEEIMRLPTPEILQGVQEFQYMCTNTMDLKQLIGFMRIGHKIYGAEKFPELIEAIKACLEGKKITIDQLRSFFKLLGKNHELAFESLIHMVSR